MPAPQQISALVTGTVVTVDPGRVIHADGAVAVAGGEIVAVGSRDDLEQRYRGETTLGWSGALVIPGMVNAHQHLTGDRLIRSAIPDRVTGDAAIFDWVMPVHAAHEPVDDELSASLALAESLTRGITTTVEAGTVAHPARVASAFAAVGARGTVGTWGWDVDEAPFAAPWPAVIERQRSVIAATAGAALVQGWVTLVGHDLMSDELVVAASELARQLDTGLTFHLSPGPADAASYLERTGRRPLEHLARLGVLGPHVLLAHAVHLDAAEQQIVVDTDTAIAYCPWAYLRLGQGVARVGRHHDLMRRGARIALGCDSENAGDRVDVLATARLAAGLARDVTLDPAALGAHEAFELATRRGAEAIGWGDTIGSIEVGKRADLVVIDRSGLAWSPLSEDPVQQLVWGAHSESVTDVLVDGLPVVRHGELVDVDVPALIAEATERRAFLVQRAGIEPASRWPLV